MFPRRDSQPGEHDDLEHDAEHLPDDGRQQRNSLGGERQRQREPEKPDRIVRKGVPALPEVLDGFEDRKSTRLNSSHLVISYAVFCLKKKKKQRTNDYAL